MKRVLFSILLVFSYCIAQSQVKLGVRSSYVLSVPMKVAPKFMERVTGTGLSTGINSSYSGDIFVEYKVNRSIGFEAGMGIVALGSKFSDNITTEDGYYANMEEQTKFNLITLPVSIKYFFKDKYVFVLGAKPGLIVSPSYSYTVEHNVNINDNQSNISTQSLYNYETSLHDYFDYAYLALFSSFEYNFENGMFIDIKNNYSMSNLFKKNLENEEYVFINNYLEIGVGCKF